MRFLKCSLNLIFINYGTQHSRYIDLCKVEWRFRANHKQICQDIIKWKKIEDTFILSTLNVSLCNLYLKCMFCFCFSQRRKEESEPMIESTMRSSSML